jgi:sortase B
MKLKSIQWNLHTLLVILIILFTSYAMIGFTNRVYTSYQYKKVNKMMQTLYNEQEIQLKSQRDHTYTFIRNSPSLSFSPELKFLPAHVASNPKTTGPFPNLLTLNSSEKVELAQPLQNQTTSFDSFNVLREKNKEIMGWIQIDSTIINYPVVQSVDNEYYMTRNVLGQKDVSGSIFIDYKVQLHNSPKHIIIYGHHMDNQTMFAPLIKYKDSRFFQKNPMIELDTLYGKSKWRIFSAYQTSINFNYLRTEFIDDPDFEQFQSILLQKSLHQTSLDVKASNRILTLSTCTNRREDDRFVVHALLIDEQ